MEGVLKWLKGLPQAMLTWPGRFLKWLVRLFWAFVDFVRELPRLTKEALLALAAAIQALGFAIVNGLISFGKAVLNVFRHPIVSLRKLLLKRVGTDPSTIPARQLTIPDRGRSVALFSRQLASMTQGGVGLLQSLDVLAEQADDPRLAFVSRDLATKLGQGYSFSKAASEYPRVFPPVYFHLLRAGESTGRLIEVIGHLADLLEREEYLLKRIKSALSYPIFVMILTSFLTLGLFTTVLPGFADFYKDFQVPLPLVTAFLMKVTAWVQTWWFWLLILLLAGSIYYGIKQSWQILERRVVMYQLLLWIPLVGPILRYSNLARFCWVMELTQEAGLDVIRSVSLSCLASGSPLLEVDSKRMTQGITEGEHLSELMEQRPDIHPHLLHQMVLMGEETSRNSDAYGRAADWFEQDVESRIEAFQAALEPILMGLISVVVGTIVLAVFLPLYGLLDKLGV